MTRQYPFAITLLFFVSMSSVIGNSFAKQPIFKLEPDRRFQPTATSMDKLLLSWEFLRQLDLRGYRTSAIDGNTNLLTIEWQDRLSGERPTKGTSCSPFVTQSIALAYSKDMYDKITRPTLSNGSGLPFVFSDASNGNFFSKETMVNAQSRARQAGMPLDFDGWPRPLIHFNLGTAIHPEQLRKGDAVAFDWDEKARTGGHAVFVWDVHLDTMGNVDAFQYISSNGVRSNGGSGLGVSVGGTKDDCTRFVVQTCLDPPLYEQVQAQLFVDSVKYTREGDWVTWLPKFTAKKLADISVPSDRKVFRVKNVEAVRLHGVTPPPPFSKQAAFSLSQDAASAANLQYACLRESLGQRPIPGLNEKMASPFFSAPLENGNGIPPRSCPPLDFPTKVECKQLSSNGMEMLATFHHELSVCIANRYIHRMAGELTRKPKNMTPKYDPLAVLHYKNRFAAPVPFILDTREIFPLANASHAQLVAIEGALPGPGLGLAMVTRGFYQSISVRPGFYAIVRHFDDTVAIYFAGADLRTWTNFSEKVMSTYLRHFYIYINDIIIRQCSSLMIDKEKTKDIIVNNPDLHSLGVIFTKDARENIDNWLGKNYPRVFFTGENVDNYFKLKSH